MTKMKMKNKIISKKYWWLKTIKQILETYIVLETDEYQELNRYLEIKGKYDFIIDYIKSDLYDNISDDLTCIGGVGGKQDEQVGIIEFVNMFSDLNLKISDFNINKKNPVGKFVDYNFKVFLKMYNDEYEYLSDFFGDFINEDENAKKILDEVINFNNKK